MGSDYKAFQYFCFSNLFFNYFQRACLIPVDGVVEYVFYSVLCMVLLVFC